MDIQKQIFLEEQRFPVLIKFTHNSFFFGPASLFQGISLHRLKNEELFLLHESLPYTSIETSDVTQDVPSNYLEMQICLNNVYIGLVTEPKYVLEVHLTHAKSNMLRLFKEDKCKFPFQINLQRIFEDQKFRNSLIANTHFKGLTTNFPGKFSATFGILDYV